MVIEEIRSMTLQAAAPEFQPAEKHAAEEVRKEALHSQPAAEGKSEVSREELQQAIESLNSAVSLLNHRLNFKIDDSTGRLTARVIDNKTNEIIREIPPERVLAFVKRFQEFLGLMVDEQA